jgi:hypothetical protein
MPKLDEFDLTIPRFPAPFRKWLMSNGIVSYKLKCLGFAPSMYVIAVLLSIATNTFPKLVTDHGAQLVIIVATVTLYGLVHGCKQIGPTINNLDKTTVHSKDAKFKDFIDWITSENSWCHIRNRYWYYIRTLGLAAIFVSLKYFIYEPGRWTIGADQNAIWINDFYNTFCWAMVGYVIGLGLELALIYTFSINRYCKELLKVESIRLLPVEELGGLKPLGNLALRINIACVVPSIYVLFTLYRMWVEEGKTVINEPLSLLMLTIYVLVLTLVFFKPIAPAHKVLVSAKEKAIKHFSRQIRQTYDHATSDNPAKNSLLCSLLSTYQSLKRAPTWPLDLPLSIGSTASILFPIIGGAFLQIWFDFLFKLFAK